VGKGINELGAQETVRPEFKDIKPGPYNPPLHFNPIKESDKKPVSVVPPKGSGPLVRIVSQGSLLMGEHRYQGKIFSSDSPDVIRFVPEEAPEVMIGLALPENFQLKQFKDAKGSLYVNDNSSLEGADQTVTLQSELGLLLGNIWRVSEKPVSYELTENVALAQIPLEKQPSGDIMLAVQVSVNTDKGMQTVPSGKNFDFTLGDKKYTVFVHTSIFQNSADPGDDTRKAYVLRAMVAEN
jgi:hypothetical protein